MTPTANATPDGRLGRVREQRNRLLALWVLGAIAAGGALHFAGVDPAAHALWGLAVATTLVPLTWSTAQTVLRGNIGVDAIALVAMAGALALGEYLAGAVIALMFSGGLALEDSAGQRARRELTALLERAPRIAHRLRDGILEEVGVEALAVGDVVLVRAGEVVPVDGIVADGHAVIDESTLTGEPLPITAARGEPVRSGTANAGDAFHLRATRLAAESAYAGIVRLVRDAGTHRGRFVRLADRYAGFFLPVTLVVAGLAWGVSGDPVRALAVLVVATPCPLILAAPIALISGVSRAARRGVIVKGSGVIEQLGRAQTVLLDKTGTLTLGTPQIERVLTLGADGLDEAEIVRLAASVDQLSAHVMAEALVHDAQARGLELVFPERVVETPGQGIEGFVGGRRVTVGTAAWVRERGIPGVDELARRLDREQDGRAKMLVGVEGRLAGAVVMADHLRPDAAALVRELHAAGARDVAMVTGDRHAIATEIGQLVGVDRVYAEQTPEEKLEVVRAMQRRPGAGPVVMVGDGINDAPALALADVGIAMGTAGATVSSETADAVITVDRIDRVADALRIGRRSLGIARQSVIAGIGLSLVAMGFAAFGYLTPIAGALLQEGIDLAVILNALRALRA